MKAKILSLVSLLALLLVSTAILADGRPTGLRIGRVANISASGVEIDITVPGTDSLYTAGPWGAYDDSVYLENGLGSLEPAGFKAYQYASPTHDVPLPWAIDWGDGSYRSAAGLQGPPGGPFVGTYRHTYPPAGMPMTYTITVGDVLCCSPVIIPPPSKGMAKGANGVTTGYVITGTNRYLSTFNNSYTTFTSVDSARLAITNTASVTTSTGIPALDLYGLLAMAFVLVGTGILIYRKPQQIAA